MGRVARLCHRVHAHASESLVRLVVTVGIGRVLPPRAHASLLVAWCGLARNTARTKRICAQGFRTGPIGRIVQTAHRRRRSRYTPPSTRATRHVFSTRTGHRQIRKRASPAGTAGGSGWRIGLCALGATSPARGRRHSSACTSDVAPRRPRRRRRASAAAPSLRL